MSELLDLTNTIAVVESEMSRLRTKMRKLTEQRRLITDRFLIGIWEEKNDHGRPVYSNQGVRDAKLDIRLHRDGGWIRLSEQLEKLTDELTKNRLEVDRFKSRGEILMLELGAQSLKERTE